MVKDLKTSLNTLRDRLVSKVNDIPTGQYADAKRFLNNFEDAIRAVERGDAVNYFAFQKFVRGGNRSVQDVVDFMIENGLSFAPSTDGDESAYQALQSAMAAYNVAMNEQLRSTVSSKGP